MRKVARPEVVSKSYKHSNSVDVHNHLRQACLKLEKKWVTLDCWFRVTTTLIGISVVDCFRLSKFHNFLPQGRVQNLIDDDLEDIDGFNEVSMKNFAGILANQLLYKAYNLGNDISMYEEGRLVEPLNPNGGGDDGCEGGDNDDRKYLKNHTSRGFARSAGS